MQSTQDQDGERSSSKALRDFRESKEITEWLTDGLQLKFMDSYKNKLGESRHEADVGNLNAKIGLTIREINEKYQGKGTELWNLIKKEKGARLGDEKIQWSPEDKLRKTQQIAKMQNEMVQAVANLLETEYKKQMSKSKVTITTLNKRSDDHHYKRMLASKLKLLLDYFPSHVRNEALKQELSTLVIPDNEAYNKFLDKGGAEKIRETIAENAHLDQQVEQFRRVKEQFKTKNSVATVSQVGRWRRSNIMPKITEENKVTATKNESATLTDSKEKEKEKEKEEEKIEVGFSRRNTP